MSEAIKKRQLSDHGNYATQTYAIPKFNERTFIPEPQQSAVQPTARL
jgi:hypothetical protein